MGMPATRRRAAKPPTAGEARPRHRPHRLQGLVAGALAAPTRGARSPGYALAPPTDAVASSTLAGVGAACEGSVRRRRPRRSPRLAARVARRPPRGRLPPGRAAARAALLRQPARDARDQRHGHRQPARGGARARQRPARSSIVTSDKCYENREWRLRATARTTRSAATTRTRRQQGCGRAGRPRPTAAASSRPAARRARRGGRVGPRRQRHRRRRLGRRPDRPRLHRARSAAGEPIPRPQPARRPPLAARARAARRATCSRRRGS